ncbi:MAG TPA: spore germination protein GerW family protein [Pyrinomonadaceae bacterium]|jgi:uncharacterized spore protein YtfJ
MEIEKPNSADRFIGTIAEKLGAVARGSTIFSEPVEREGVTVIPVAKAQWGFGGGIGHRKDEEGAGGGGGVRVTPVGFIEIKNGHSEFRPIRAVSMPLLIVGGISILMLLRQTLKRSS